MDAFFAFIESDFFRNAGFMIGVLVAVVSIMSAKVTARKKQTMDLLLNVRDDDDLSEGLDMIRKLHDSNDTNMRKFASMEQLKTPECAAIRYVLNHYEYISIGVQAGIYDEDMLHSAGRATLVNTFKCAKPFIEAARENVNRPTIYQEGQWLANRWEKRPIKPKKNGS